MDSQYPITELLRAEYERIKSEQAQRIAFRDNALFVHLAATGAVTSWVLTNLDKPYAIVGLLVVPWLCVIMGWTYVVNDYHISRIGKYVRTVLDPRAVSLCVPRQITVQEGDGVQFEISEFFGWEPFHRIDKRREMRKRLQFFIDEFTFVLPGVASLIGYLHIKQWIFDNHAITALLVIEVQALLLVSVVIFTYADLIRSK